MIADTFDELYPKLIYHVLDHGEPSAPRGLPIKEILGASFTLLDPTRGTCLNAARKLNYAFHAVEKLEYLFGESDPTRLCFYNGQMSRFLNPETKQFDGAYAPRFGRQWKYVYELLLRDPDSRQAVLNVNAEVDKKPSLDVPCTVSLQFFLRQGQLHLVTTMRSNDLLLGTPYDVAAFTFLQEVMARWLGAQVGRYVHQAGSLHAYEPNFDQLRTIARPLVALTTYDRPRWELNFEDTFKFLKLFFLEERAVREGQAPDPAFIAGLPACLVPDAALIFKYAQKKLQK